MSQEAITHLVVRFFDGETPVEVTPFFDAETAEAFYEDASLCWTECFLCKVLRGPGVDEASGDPAPTTPRTQSEG